MKKTYSQSNVTVLVNGIPLKDLSDGNSIRVRHRGGEVEPTEGTDGAAMNIATRQGGEIEVDLKEMSSSLIILNALRLAQEQTGIGCNVVIRSGVDVVDTLATAFVSLPGEKATGDKKMGKITYKFSGTVLTGSNL
ncbi:MAG TPA: hypothetical protein DDW84_00175 [Phycisphaerales bacterium]|nr:MAG: hypothetical protein A2Y13_01980 [Planctomycetes bacterium GWC2_45_44]HBG77253.1 hypothetical protein [Phycisphaerales bacterium]HBR19190.1 hypothetical protein [Phycisphaerales bacterium]